MTTGLDPIGRIIIGFAFGAVAGWFVPSWARRSCWRWSVG
jgi:hypothetical protein